MERLAKHERHSMDAMACIRHACATAHHLHAPRGLAPTSPQSWHLCQPMQWSSNALVRSHTPGSTKNNRRCAIALYACENCEPQGQRGIEQMQTLCLQVPATQPQQCHPQSHHLPAHSLMHPTPASCSQRRAASAPNLVLTTSRITLFLDLVLLCSGSLSQKGLYLSSSRPHTNAIRSSCVPYRAHPLGTAGPDNEISASFILRNVCVHRVLQCPVGSGCCLHSAEKAKH
jgi:hypothetical protein